MRQGCFHFFEQRNARKRDRFHWVVSPIQTFCSSASQAVELPDQYFLQKRLRHEPYSTEFIFPSQCLTIIASLLPSHLRLHTIRMLAHPNTHWPVRSLWLLYNGVIGNFHQCDSYLGVWILEEDDGETLSWLYSLRFLSQRESLIRLRAIQGHYFFYIPDPIR